MSTYQFHEPLSIDAGSDLSASQHCFMNINASGQLALPSAGGTVVGVLCDAPAAAGRPGEVQTRGIAKVKFGGSVAAGGAVKASAAGKAVAASAADVAAGSCKGIALAAYVDGDVGSVLLTNIGVGMAGVSGVETLSAPGVVSVNTVLTRLAIDGTDPHTIADGLYDGQIKEILAVSAANTPSSVVTGAFLEGTTARTTATFNAAADYLKLCWSTTADAWQVLIATSVVLA